MNAQESRFSRGAWKDRTRLRDRLRTLLSAPTVAASLVCAVVLAGVLVFVLTEHHTVKPDDRERSLTGAAGHEETAAGINGQEAGVSASKSGGRPGPDNAHGQSVVVHVIGEVHKPGLVTLPAGSRVSDALTAAGEPTKAAALEAVNLARVLIDGEQIAVPNAKDAKSAAAPSAPQAENNATGSGGTSSDHISINSATAQQLQSLSGIGPALAQRIIDWRDEHGGFQSVEQLQEVSGIGPKIFERLKPSLVL
jgi:competence protein ComEA